MTTGAHCRIPLAPGRFLNFLTMTLTTRRACKIYNIHNIVVKLYFELGVLCGAGGWNACIYSVRKAFVLVCFETKNINFHGLYIASFISSSNNHVDWNFKQQVINTDTHTYTHLNTYLVRKIGSKKCINSWKLLTHCLHNANYSPKYNCKSINNINLNLIQEFRLNPISLTCKLHFVP